MNRRTITCLGVALLAALPLIPAHADDWDFGPDNDNGPGTDNALVHGSEQVHDMLWISGPVDEDWYLAVGRTCSSYEVVVDGMTSDLDFVGPSVQLLNSAGTLVLTDAIVLEAGGVLSLRWLTGVGLVDRRVRVRNPACGTACSESDSYRIHFYDTTYTVPRFNNSGTQTTILLVQNATDRTCSTEYDFFNGAGVKVATVQSGLSPRGMEILPTASVVPGASGSVRVSHSCGYGGLSGKAVALEPSTGFTFDTPFVARPN